jgi:hypothetical protein
MKVLNIITVDHVFLETATKWFLQKVQSSFREVATTPNTSVHA